MEIFSDFPARAMPVLPASGVCRRSWPRAAVAEVQLGVQSRPRGSVIRRMSDNLGWSSCFSPPGAAAAQFSGSA